MARGGVYLMGGVIARVYERIRDGRFSEAFCAKGAHSAAMMKIPVKAVTNERSRCLGLLSWCCRHRPTEVFGERGIVLSSHAQ
jgi:glucokinase